MSAKWSHMITQLLQVTWLVATKVWSKSFRMVTERHLCNALPIYACCCYVRPVLFFIVECGIARFLCKCACYVRIWHSGIILTPRLPLCQILFLSHYPTAELARREQSDTQSLNQLIWYAGNQRFASAKFQQHNYKTQSQWNWIRYIKITIHSLCFRQLCVITSQSVREFNQLFLIIKHNVQFHIIKLDETRRSSIEGYAFACCDLDLLIPKAKQHIYECIYNCDQNICDRGWVKFPSLVVWERLCSHQFRVIAGCNHELWPQKLMSTSMRPFASGKIPRIGCWDVVHKVFGCYPKIQSAHLWTQMQLWPRMGEIPFTGFWDKVFTKSREIYAPTHRWTERNTVCIQHCFSMVAEAY